MLIKSENKKLEVFKGQQRSFAAGFGVFLLVVVFLLLFELSASESPFETDPDCCTMQHFHENNNQVDLPLSSLF